MKCLPSEAVNHDICGPLTHYQSQTFMLGVEQSIPEFILLRWIKLVGCVLVPRSHDILMFVSKKAPKNQVCAATEMDFTDCVGSDG